MAAALSANTPTDCLLSLSPILTNLPDKLPPYFLSSTSIWVQSFYPRSRFKGFESRMKRISRAAGEAITPPLLQQKRK